MKIDIKKIEKQVLDFLNRLAGRIPEVLRKAAEIAIKLIDRAQEILNGGGALLAIELMPELEPYRSAILNILQGLETAIKALAGTDPDYAKGVYFTAASKITALQHGNALKMNRYNLVVQNAYSMRPSSQTKITA